MSIDQFIAELETNIVGAEPGTLRADTKFRELPYWDSLAALTTLAAFDACYGRQISVQELAQCTTIQDIHALARGA